MYSFGILLLEMFIARKPTDEMFREGLSLNKSDPAMDKNQVLKVADQRLINHSEYSSTQDFSTSASHGGGSEDTSNGEGYTHWTHKAEECLVAVIRVGLCCTAHHPKDRWTMREALTKLQGIRLSMLAL